MALSRRKYHRLALFLVFGCSYVDAGAPKPQRPTMCLVLGAGQLGQAACDASNPHVRRLCPCTNAVA